jgi:hypothetical protein
MKKDLFKDWDIGSHIAESPYGNHKLWIANGFSFFEDQGRPFVNFLPIWTRWVIWREMKKEIRRRAYQVLNE